ncbi:MAG: TIGR01777 family oxidoreductase [Thiomicrorhabdus sp.]|jgi:uncharacterized protein (TIGR01777 family)|nr:TIGR01777 family oxidoreductase [Thiomicrorhabdus sp.]
MKAVMNIIILGGTGFVGTYLQSYLRQQGHAVVALGREAFTPEFDLTAHLENQDLLIMLAGENVGQRWNAQYKKALLESRTLTNQALKQALETCQNPPKRIFSASAVGIYPQNGIQTPVDESCTQVGEGFLGELGQQWEAASLQLSPQPVVMRFGVVLGTNGGALQKMLPAFKLGLGGPVAGGAQAFSWIHIEDLARAVGFLIMHPELSGIFNLTAPNPLSNRDFGQALADALHRPFWLPMPRWMLSLMFGEGAQVLTHSSAVIPQRLIAAGFQFDYPEIKTALTDLLDK